MDLGGAIEFVVLIGNSVPFVDDDDAGSATLHDETCEPLFLMGQVEEGEQRVREEGSGVEGVAGELVGRGGDGRGG